MEEKEKQALEEEIIREVGWRIIDKLLKSILFMLLLLFIGVLGYEIGMHFMTEELSESCLAEIERTN